MEVHTRTRRRERTGGRRETFPTFSRQLSRKRPQEFTDEQKENKDDQPRPIRTRRLKKGPSELTENQSRESNGETPEVPKVQARQESAGNNKGSRKRPQVDTAETEDTYNKKHYDEGHPPLFQAKTKCGVRFRCGSRREPGAGPPS